MSTFRVYGMTECKARQLARASTPPHARETLDEYEERVQKRFESIMNSNRQVPISAAFDAPQYAEQFIRMAKQAGRSRNLCIKYPKKVLVRKRKKSVYQTVWQEYTRD